MRKILFIALLCLPMVGNAQGKKFLSKFDTLIVLNNYADDFSLAIDEQLDPHDFDQDLLAQAVMIVLNEKRAAKNRGTLNYNKNLDIIARNYTALYSKSRFKAAFNKKFRAKNTLNKAARLANYRSGIMKTVVGDPILINHRNGPYWYNRKSDEGFRIYKGNRPSPRDSTHVPELIEAHTYRSFAEQLLNQTISSRSLQLLMDKSFDYVACSVEVNQTTFFKSRLPSAKAIILVGGRRLKFVTEKYGN